MENKNITINVNFGAYSSYSSMKPSLKIELPSADSSLENQRILNAASKIVADFCDTAIQMTDDGDYWSISGGSDDESDEGSDDSSDDADDDSDDDDECDSEPIPRPPEDCGIDDDLFELDPEKPENDIFGQLSLSDIFPDVIDE